MAFFKSHDPTWWSHQCAPCYPYLDWHPFSILMPRSSNYSPGWKGATAFSQNHLTLLNHVIISLRFCLHLMGVPWRPCCLIWWSYFPFKRSYNVFLKPRNLNVMTSPVAVWFFSSKSTPILVVMGLMKKMPTICYMNISGKDVLTGSTCHIVFLEFGDKKHFGTCFKASIQIRL